MKGNIRRNLKYRTSCNAHEARIVELAEIKEKVKYTYKWQRHLPKYLKYKNPFLLNGHEFTKKPSPNGTLPDDWKMHDGSLPVVLSDTSDEPEETDKEEETKEVKKVNEFQGLDEDEIAFRKKNPLQELPDVSKFDKVFILPIICKPGKHNYLIKYKDTEETRQKHNIMRKRKQEKRLEKEKMGVKPDKSCNKTKLKKAKEALKPEVFFYKVDIPVRQEEIPTFAKTMGTKAFVRKFDYDSSMWKAWKMDTPALVDRAFDADIKLWKGFRFIKDADELKATEAVLKQYYKSIKNIWHTVSSNSSSFPCIGQLDFDQFATKSKFVKDEINTSALDRCFIAA